MLQSTARRFPLARLGTTLGGFGVSLDAQTSMRVSYSGRWTPEDMRDCLALFAVWLVADPDALLGSGTLLVGVLQAAQRELEQSSTQQA